ncbi:MAG: FAD-binding oxidoreductase [Candidatus Doudnabacteria bacterium]|nr:FAD-binding oxidoreductase [Candidatus Doudnabacteria bacterium]
MVDFNEIKKQFKGEVLTDEATLHSYSRDASIFEIMPACVVKPKDVADVKALVKWVSQNKAANPGLSITARSAGTDMSGGAINNSILADFPAHFNRVEMFGKNFSVAEPGVYYRDFEKMSLERGLILPCYTASKSLNTLGGMVGNNSAGEKSLAYGQTKDYVEELNVILSDGNEYVFKDLDDRELESKLKLPGFEGEIYRKTFRLVKDHYDLIQKAKPTTSKNSAGYLLWEIWNKSRFNLAKLITGSQGTLGLVTKIKFRLVKPKPKSELLVIFLKDMQKLGEIIDCIAAYKPESFESFDDHTFKLAMRFLPDMIKRMKGGLISLGLKFLPELWMTLTGGVPKLILIAEFTGETETEIYQKLFMAEKEIQSKFRLKTHITQSPQEAEKYWIIRRESFNLLRQHSKGLSTAPFIDDIVVHPAQLPQFLPELNAILAKYPSLIYTIAGHMGDANFHIIPLMDLSRADQRMIIPKLADKVYDLVLKYKGSITAEHNDGLIRSPYLEKMYGSEITALFKEVKEIFDPQNIFNPGKKVGASLEYAMAHIKKS